MSATYVGSFSIGTLCPSAFSAVGVAYGELAGKLAGLVKVSAALTIRPPSLSANISAAAKVAASLALTIDGPTATLQISALASMIAALELQVSALLALQATLGTAGVHVLKCESTAATLGSDISVITSSGIGAGGQPTDNIKALVLAASTPSAWAAMQAFFAGALA